MRLVFQRSDFPVDAHWKAARHPSVDEILAAAGFEAASADYSAEIPHGSTDTLYVSGRVIVLANATQARRLFAQYKSDLALTREVVAGPPPFPRSACGSTAALPPARLCLGIDRPAGPLDRSCVLPPEVRLDREARVGRDGQSLAGEGNSDQDRARRGLPPLRGVRVAGDVV
jgi:hypothetical protein